MGGMGKANLLDDAGVEAWISEHEPDGLAKLRKELELGSIAGVRARAATEYLNRHVRMHAAVAEAQRVAREERAVKAAEDAAKASKDSARAAAIAIGISLVALGVAVAQLWKP